MGQKLEQLSKFIAESFTEAGKEPEEIKKLVELTKLVEEAKIEDQKLLDTNAELSKGYKELVEHTAGTMKASNDPIQKEKELPDFDEALNNWSNGMDLFGEKLREKGDK